MIKQSVPVLDLYQQYKSLKKEIDLTLKTVVKKSAFINGEYVLNFENAFAHHCNTKYAVSLNSGTDALYLALWSLGLKKGDQVITSPFTFFATAEVICRLGAKPVFADIGTDFNLDPDLIEEKITSKTKVILPVHLFGKPANMTKIRQLAKKYHLLVVEDACQAVGAQYQQKMTGNLGNLGCFSFYPTKNLNAWGDGGMVTTNDAKLAQKITMARNHGCLVKYDNKFIGFSSRLDGLQAALLTLKLKHLDTWNQKRREIAQEYTQAIKPLEWIQTPVADTTKTKSVFHQYTIRIINGQRDNLKKYLQDQGIASMIYYPRPLHLLDALKHLRYKQGAFPQCEKACEEVLSLPIYPEMTNKQIMKVVHVILAFRSI